ncbi:MAG TPA: peptide ABC transporter permease, partial [Tistrella mobilis]|nr:peptide ABC transporter permease [Tistrella mobilis]
VALLAGERGLTPERHAQMLAQLGLDRPMVEQYFSYLWSLAQGDFGRSLVTRSPVLNDFLTLFPATLELSFAAMIFAVAIGLPAGILAAVRRGSALDHTVMAGALTGYSMPIFWW